MTALPSAAGGLDAGWCSYCGARRPTGELLEVIEIRSGWTRFVCRPDGAGVCFRREVRGREVERIEVIEEPDEGRGEGPRREPTSSSPNLPTAGGPRPGPNVSGDQS